MKIYQLNKTQASLFLGAIEQAEINVMRSQLGRETQVVLDCSGILENLKIIYNYENRVVNLSYMSSPTLKFLIEQLSDCEILMNFFSAAVKYAGKTDEAVKPVPNDAKQVEKATSTTTVLFATLQRSPVPDRTSADGYISDDEAEFASAADEKFAADFYDALKMSPEDGVEVVDEPLSNPAEIIRPASRLR